MSKRGEAPESMNERGSKEKSVVAFSASRLQTANHTLRNDTHTAAHASVMKRNGKPQIMQISSYRSMDRTHRKPTEEKLQESEGRLRLALESGRMYAFEWDFRADVMRWSVECKAVLGIPSYPLEEAGKRFLHRLHPGDRLRYVEAIKELTPPQDTYVISYRKQLPDGRTCWIETRGRGFFDAQGRLSRIVGIASDVTARKESEDALRELSARLINAQEEERKRFARELHDGVSQALAVISVEIAQAASAAANAAANTAADADLRSRLQRLYAKVQDIVSDIGQLSHELHPSTLKHLGLTAAIRFLCREVSESHGIDVEFKDNGTPKLPPKEVSLCLYRVAQEALQNVVRHSGAKRAWVELKGGADEIRLCILDEGTGFDIRSKKNGLGLVSMRERLRLAGGKVAISSRRNSGTHIEATVPLVPVVKAAA